MRTIRPDRPGMARLAPLVLLSLGWPWAVVGADAPAPTPPGGLAPEAAPAPPVTLDPTADGTVALEPADFAVEAWKSRVLTFSLPSGLPPGKTVMLDFDGREWGSGLEAGGSNEYLKLWVNGREAREAKDRLSSHLRNKPRRVRLPSGTNLAWFGTIWRLVQAPEFAEAHRGPFGPEAFHFAIDIGRLVKAGTNTLTFYAWPWKGRTMSIRGASVRVADAPSDPAGFALKPGGRAVRGMGREGMPAARYGPHFFPVSTSFSIPGGGWNRLGPPVAPRTGEQPAAVRVAPWKGSSGSAAFDAGAYAVRRSVTAPPASPGMLLVRDTITNATDADLGMMVRYELPLPSPVKDVHLGGDPNPSAATAWAPWNPIVAVPLGPLLLGLVARDDALRAQGQMSYYDGSDPGLCPYHATCSTPFVSLRTEQLAIPPRGSYTLEWSFYALPGGDYYTLVNQVRRDWGVKMTIDGPYWWGFWPEKVLGMTDDALRAFYAKNRPYAMIMDGEWIDRLKPKTAGGKFQIGLGLGVADPYFAPMRKRLVDARARMKALFPELKYGTYAHIYNNAPIDPAAYPDAWVTGAGGKRQSYDAGGYDTPAYTLFPTLENDYGKAYLAMIAAQRREIGNDAVYVDETDIPSPSYNGLNYAAWDGKTAILNSDTFAIIKKAGYTFLLSGDFEQALVAGLRKEGIWVLGNGQPATMAANRQTWPRFTEMQNHVDRGYEGHLYSNIAYGSLGVYTVQTLRDDLELGMIYAMTAPADKLGITKHFFPITVVSLRPGVVAGEERVIASRSGDYGWLDRPYEGRLWTFDAAGKPAEAEPAWRPLRGPLHVEVPEGGIAVLERKPAG